jgi:hypothetical protein
LDPLIQISLRAGSSAVRPAAEIPLLSDIERANAREAPATRHPRVALPCVNFGILIFDCNALNFLMRFEQPDLRLSNTQVSLLASAFPLTWVKSPRRFESVGGRVST